MQNHTSRYAQEFYDLDNLNADRIIFIDETGFCVSMRLRQGRSRKGTPARIKVKSVRSKNISVVAAMSIGGLVSFKAQDSSYNGIDFRSYLVELMDSLNAQGKTGCTLVMDNVAFHKMGIVQAAVREKGHSLLFLPPYSPMLNPIEELFNQWKHWVKVANCKTKDQLDAAIATAAARVTGEHCFNYWRHMRSFLPRALRGEEL
jgi:hypothetical protein